jgi:hypothetical protein
MGEPESPTVRAFDGRIKKIKIKREEKCEFDGAAEPNNS